MAYKYSSDLQQSAALEMLLASHPTLLSRSEIRREIDDQVAADDALAYFERLGLVHRIEGRNEDFFWPTRTAMATEEAATAPMDCDRAVK